MQYRPQPGGIQKQISGPQGALRKYWLTVIGNRSLQDFIVYELLTMFLMPFPGKIGKRLRQLACTLVLGKFGRNVTFDKDITLRKPKQIKVGNGVKIGIGSVLDVKGKEGTICLGNHVSIGEKTIFNCIDGDIIVDESTRIGKHARLGSLQGLKIGRKCVIGDYVYLSGAAHAFHDFEQPIIEQPLTCRGPIIIGDDVVIGERVTVNDGVRIGNHAVIASGSFVNIDIPAETYAVGVPARYFLNKKELADV